MNYITNASLEIFASLIIFILFFAGFPYKKERASEVSLALIMLSASLGLLTDAVTWLLLGKTEYFSLLKMIWIPNYLITNLCLIAFHYYFYYFLTAKVKIHRMWKWIVWPVMLCMLVLWSVSMQNGMLYYFDENALFHYTSLHWISQAGAGFILVIDSILVLYYHKKIRRRDCFFFLSFIILPLIATMTEKLIHSTVLVYLALSVSIILNFVFGYLRQRELLVRREKELKENQLEIMMSQIRPHFLFNSITSIMALCKKDSDKAVSALGDFAAYLRNNLDSIGQDTMIPFQKELKHIETYLRLEKLRFQDKINVEYEIECEEFLVPTLSLQPLIENAIKHGITKRREGGTILLHTFEEERFFCIEVKDDGVGFDMKTISYSNVNDEKKHIGLENVRNRLEICCKASIEIESEKYKGTTVCIRIPKNK